MRTYLIGAVSALALTAGAALAQSTTPSGGATGSGTTGTTMPSTTAPAATPETETGTPAPRVTGPATTATNAVSSGENVRVERMLGKTVRGSDGQEIGEVEDILLDAKSGAAKQVIVSSGGFLGIGTKQIAIDYSAVSVDNENRELRVSNLTQEAVRTMPEFEYSDSMSLLSRSATGSSSPSDTGATGTSRAPAGQ